MFSLADRSSTRKASNRSSTVETNVQDDNTSEEEDNAPLFYCPGKRGFYAPRQGKASYERLNAFRNVGRYVVLLTFLNYIY